MNQYQNMLRHILVTGTGHDDRTGTGTKRVFGYHMRFDLSDGFPLLTTKKLAFRWIAEELFWMLSGSTFEPDLRAKGGEQGESSAPCEKDGVSMRDEEWDHIPAQALLWHVLGVPWGVAAELLHMIIPPMVEALWKVNALCTRQSIKARNDAHGRSG